MKKLFIVLILLLSISTLFAETKEDMETTNNPKDTLAVLWTSGDPEVAEKVCFMYTHNAKKLGWFQSVTLIVWGPSAKLLSENNGLQKQVKAMIADGVELKACKACADAYGVSEKLSSLGIEVVYMGMPLTQYLKNGNSILNF